ncbi:MAG: hypothetical protein C4527_13890 [Candidatus Omnitrophota bacterium]|jgi:predicted nuclease of predicted toxin-antitoxin system|nr:MAG: hypothetical protein C4527_13890 [Candidatus Omnitrophota bacterium]
MKIVVDMNLSPSWIPLLESEGYETRHWGQIGKPYAPDTEIMQWACNHGYAVLTHDLDYGALLFATQATAPSVIQLRIEDVRPHIAGEIVMHALRKTNEQIEQGALITIDVRKSRIHLLPLRRKSVNKSNGNY